jgi:hypothetical protein
MQCNSASCVNPCCGESMARWNPARTAAQGRTRGARKRQAALLLQCGKQQRENGNLVGGGSMQRAKVCIYTGSQWVNRGQGGMNARAATGTRMVRDGLAPPRATCAAQGCHRDVLIPANLFTPHANLCRELFHACLAACLDLPAGTQSPLPGCTCKSSFLEATVQQSCSFPMRTFFPRSSKRETTEKSTIRRHRCPSHDTIGRLSCCAVSRHQPSWGLTGADVPCMRLCLAAVVRRVCIEHAYAFL